jgi:NSS family neurotransmitter:Na+ symporter
VAGASADFQHESWTSRRAFLLAAIGAAVGLGNLWRFPFIAGQNGGAGFVLLYLGFVFLLGLPVMVGEMLIGRRGKQSAVGTMNRLVEQDQHSPFWKSIGWLSVGLPFLGLTYYSVVAAWSLDYLGLAVTGAFGGITGEDAQQNFALQIGKPFRQLLLHGLFIASVVVVVSRGLHGGIERISKIAMPALFAILVGLVVYNLVAADFMAAVKFLFTPDFSSIGTEAVLTALGQALFSLAIGVGVHITFSAYLPEKFSLVQSAGAICIGDTLVALLAGLAIFPIVFQYGLSPGEGPGLIFVTLPIAFGQMPGGLIIGSLFFLLLFIAAYTTGIAMVEPIVSWLEEHRGAHRPTMTVACGFFAWIGGIVSVLSFSLLANVYPLDFLSLFEGKTFFDIVDFIVANVMLPVNALLIALFVGWALDRGTTADELGTSGGPWYLYWRFALRFLVPIALIAIMLDLWFG